MSSESIPEFEPHCYYSGEYENARFHIGALVDGAVKKIGYVETISDGIKWGEYNKTKGNVEAYWIADLTKPPSKAIVWSSGV